MKKYGVNLNELIRNGVVYIKYNLHEGMEFIENYNSVINSIAANIVNLPVNLITFDDELYVCTEPRLDQSSEDDLKNTLFQALSSILVEDIHGDKYTRFAAWCEWIEFD